VTEVNHPLFARFFDRFSQTMERDAGHYREEMLAGLKGRVLELGANPHVVGAAVAAA
jgi:hypothetical protein